jgi:hypothetical protein
MLRLLQVPAFLTVLSFAVSSPGAEKAAPSPPKTSPAKHLLRYKFRQGESLRWEVSHRARVETTVSGTSQTADTQTTSVKLWRVKSVEPDGSATIEYSVESVDMRHKLSGRIEVRYNSQTDKTPPLGFETVSKSIGVPLSTITLDAMGKVLKRENTAAAKTSQDKESQVTIPLPEEAVPVGHSWSFRHEIELKGNNDTFKRIKALQTFNLEEVSEGVAAIRVATQILSPMNDPAVEAQVAQRESSGVVRFHIAAGRVLGQQMDVDKQVVGFSGQASSLHYRMKFSEKYLGDVAAESNAEKEPAGAVAKTASRPKPPVEEPTLAPPKASKDGPAPRKSTEPKPSAAAPAASPPAVKPPAVQFVVPPEPRATGKR